MTLKFYTSVAKVLKLKVRKFCELRPTFVEATGEKLVGGPSWTTSLPPSLLRVWSHLMKKSLLENLIFCAVQPFRGVPRKSFSENMQQIYRRTPKSCFWKNNVSVKDFFIKCEEICFWKKNVSAKDFFINPLMHNVRKWSDILDVFWAPYVRSIYVLWLLGNTLNIRCKTK